VRHVLVVANETLPGAALFERVRERVGEGDLVTVIAPVNVPSQGYVVYEDTRRAAAGRRLDRTLARLREVGVPAYGLVVEASPPDAVRDALATLEPRPDEVIVSTHPNPRSGWLRKDLVEQIRKAAGAIPVEHVIVDLKDERETNVLVIANETVIGEPLLEKIRARAARSRASFLLICPQSDPHEGEHPEAERRLRRALAILRADGIEAHGQIAHPDPYTAAVHAVRDERVDEIIISTFPGERSGWLRRDVVERVRKETGLPVEHVVTAPELVGASA
jgi:hypothetical protein